jgi:hypothetical protein
MTQAEAMRHLDKVFETFPSVEEVSIDALPVLSREESAAVIRGERPLLRDGMRVTLILRPKASL